MQQQYVRLIESFCALLSITDSAAMTSVVQGGAIDIDDVRFSFAYSATNAPDRLLVFCDYGAVPEQQQAKVYRSLLETNLFLYDSDAAVYSVMPDSGRVLCATRFMLQALKPEELRSIVTLLAQRATDWRRSHFDVAMVRRDTPASSMSSMAASLRTQLRAQT